MCEHDLQPAELANLFPGAVAVAEKPAPARLFIPETICTLCGRGDIIAGQGDEPSEFCNFCGATP